MIKFKNTLLNICWDNARFRSSAKRQNSVLTGLLISLMLFFGKIRMPTRVSAVNSFDKVIAKIINSPLFAGIFSFFLHKQNTIDI